MRIVNLGSGSGGNATVVSEDGRAILIDAGLPKRRTLAGLDGLRLDAVLITHRHGDHLGRYAQELGAPVWIDEANAVAAADRGQIDPNVEIFATRPFRAGPFRVTPFRLSHGGGEGWTSWGFRVESRGRTLAYATDLGCVTPDVIEAMRGADVVFLESNHDVELERASGRHPSHVGWVLSDRGHLSNEQAAEALARIGRPHTVVLGHLSRDCNTPALARKAASAALGRETRLLLASQNEALEVRAG